MGVAAGVDVEVEVGVVGVGRRRARSRLESTCRSPPRPSVQVSGSRSWSAAARRAWTARSPAGAVVVADDLAGVVAGALVGRRGARGRLERPGRAAARTDPWPGDGGSPAPCSSRPARPSPAAWSTQAWRRHRPCPPRSGLPRSSGPWPRSAPRRCRSRAPIWSVTRPVWPESVAGAALEALERCIRRGTSKASTATSSTASTTSSTFLFLCRSGDRVGPRRGPGLGDGAHLGGPF